MARIHFHIYFEKKSSLTDWIQCVKAWEQSDRPLVLVLDEDESWRLQPLREKQTFDFHL